jgi:hypothetical protein
VSESDKAFWVTFVVAAFVGGLTAYVLTRRTTKKGAPA